MKPKAIETMAAAPTKLLIIDAGHGGADGGAVSASGQKESEINIDIALKMKALADFLGLKSCLTRTSEELPYPDDLGTITEKKRWDQNQRLNLIASSDNPVFISIHQNFYPDKRPYGPQVLYGAENGSEELGKLCHDALNTLLCPDNRRVAAPCSDKIYLMKNAHCPAILIECGFMSNPNELSRLLSKEYQCKIASIIVESYIAYIA